MSDASPYTAPEADLNQTSEETYEPKLLAFSGRIGRLRYLAYAFLFQMIFNIVIGIILGISGGNEFMLGLLGVLGVIFSFVIMISFIKRRLNDLNKSGWWAILFIIPFINFIMGLYILFAPGTKGSNDFGPEPCANSLPIKIFGFLVPLFIIGWLGVMASIAVPQYQQYIERAQQAQQQ